MTENTELNQKRKTHFWVSTAPFFKTELFVVPAFNTEAEVYHNAEADIVIYDPDGAKINSVTVEFGKGKTGLLELDPLLGGCKSESGLQYAHLEIDTDLEVRACCRMKTAEKAALMGEPRFLAGLHSVFYPVAITAEGAPFLGLINTGDELVNVRCRLFCGKRTPETDINIPGRGSRILSLKDEFVDDGSIPEGQRIQAYARLSCREEDSVAAFLLERNTIFNEKDFYSSVC